MSNEIEKYLIVDEDGSPLKIPMSEMMEIFPFPDFNLNFDGEDGSVKVLDWFNGGILKALVSEGYISHFTVSWKDQVETLVRSMSLYAQARGMSVMSNKNLRDCLAVFD